MSWWLFPLIRNKKFIGLHIISSPCRPIPFYVWIQTFGALRLLLPVFIYRQFWLTGDSGNFILCWLSLVCMHFFKVNIISLSNSATLFQITQSSESPIGKKFTVQRYLYLFHLSKTVQVFPQSAICKEQWAFQPLLPKALSSFKNRWDPRKKSFS